MTAARAIVIGTRGSRLARIQTEIVLDLLRKQGLSTQPEIRVVRTEGDRTQAQGTPLQDLPRGVFVKELEAALLDGSIDVAVHSLKDLTTDVAPGLIIAAVPEREDPRDVLVTRRADARGQARAPILQTLPPGARIGTSSPRRARQLLAVRPDLRFESIRGNVDTRVAKVMSGEYDGTVLAAAGLRRLGLDGHIAEYFDPEVCLPDPGQGALAVQVRADDTALVETLRGLDHGPSRATVTAERALLQELGGGCKVPIGALGEVEDGWLTLRGLVASPDSPEMMRGKIRGPVAEAEAIGRALADLLMKRGAGRLLAMQ